MIIENQQLYKENDKLTKHVYTLEEQLASLKNETESTDEESTSSETTVVPQVTTSNSFLPLSDAKENTKEETNLKKTERVNEIEEINIIIDSHGNGISTKKMYRNKNAKVTFYQEVKKQLQVPNNIVNITHTLNILS